jgi:hypothetical protein
MFKGYYTIRNMIATLPSMYYYARIRSPKHWGWLSGEAEDDNALRQLGIETHQMSIAPSQHRAYFEKAEYGTRYPGYYPENIHEKSLEHFIAQQLLQLSPNDAYIDIASENSPVPEIYSRLYGCRTYAQDLAYEPGIHGSRIGGNASSLPVPDGFATKMGLHCSFEHFEGDSDIGFIRESTRVLRAGGSLVIVPLCLSPRYTVVTDPLVAGPQRVRFESDATVLAVKGFGNRHARFYDAAHLYKRVIQNASGLQITIIHLMNAGAVHASCYAQFALVAKKL